MKNYITEFIGTFFLMFTIVLSVAEAGSFAPLAIGTALMVMVYAGGPISGGHYNPAVTLAVWMRGKFQPADIPGYIIAQLAGAGVAAYAANYILGVTAGSGMEVEGMPAFLAEFLGTFALCFVVLLTAVAKRAQGNSYFGLAIGFTVAAMAYAVGGITGGAFNPAVMFGGMLGGLFAWGGLLIYLSSNILGGIAAALVVKYVDED